MAFEREGRVGQGAATWLCALAAGLVSCTATESDLVSLRQAAQREATSLSLVSASSADGRVFVQAEAHAPLRFEAGETEGVYGLRVPITAESTIDCLVLPAAYQLGNLVARAAAGVPALPVATRRLFNLDAGIMSERPYVAVEWGGLAEQNDERAYFEVKAAGISLGLGSLLCLLDDIGYRNTFRRVLSVMAASIRLKGTEPEREPAFRQVYLFETGDRPIGFAEERYHHLPDDTWVTLSRSTMLLPRSFDELTGWDTVSIQRSDRNGSLVAKAAAAAEPGGSGYELEMRALQPGEYVVAGRFEGEELRDSFKTTTVLADDRGMMIALSDALVHGSRDQISIERWQPRPDPRRATEVEIRRLGVTEGDQTRCEILDGGMRYSATLDDDGIAVEIRTSVGDAEIVQRRVLARGDLRIAD